MAVRRKWLFVVGCGLVVLTLSGVLVQRHRRAARAARLVRLMYQAESQTDYAGVVESRCWNGKRYLKTVAHVINEHPHKFRITYYSGSKAGDIWAHNQREFWSLDDGKCIVVPNRLPEAWEWAEKTKLDLLLNNYQVVVNPSAEWVARRETMQVALMPRHEGNPMRKFWVDKETHLILRREQYNARGGLTSSTRFLNIVFQPALREHFFQAPERARPVTETRADEINPATVEEIEHTAQVKVQPPQHVPDGYQLEGYYLYRCACCDTSAALLRYSDGLNLLSIFESHPQHLGCLKLSPPKRRAAALCVVCGLGGDNVARAVFPSRLVAVVGNLPRQQLKDVARSVPEE